MGATGRPVLRKDTMVVLSESSTFFLASPFLNQYETCRHIGLTPSKDMGSFQDHEQIKTVSSLEEMSLELENILKDRDLETVSMIAALNIPALLSFVKQCETLDISRLQMFASTKISCGVDGCKSCYLHSRDLPLGISVCCNGPYLPFAKVDFEEDHRCFHMFD